MQTRGEVVDALTLLLEPGESLAVQVFLELEGSRHTAGASIGPCRNMDQLTAIMRGLREEMGRKELEERGR